MLSTMKVPPRHTPLQFRKRGEMVIEDILEHYGTKGMKWGVRKSRVPKVGPSDDALEAHRSFVTAQRSGPQALSNSDLQKLNNRLNLEQNYEKLQHTPNRFQKALKSIDNLMKAGKTVDSAIEFTKTGTGKKLMGLFTKKAATTSATTATKATKP